MNKQNTREPENEQPLIEDLAVEENREEEVKGGSIAVPNLLASRRSANGAS